MAGIINRTVINNYVADRRRKRGAQFQKLLRDMRSDREEWELNVLPVLGVLGDVEYPDIDVINDDNRTTHPVTKALLHEFQDQDVARLLIMEAAAAMDAANVFSMDFPE